MGPIRAWVALSAVAVASVADGAAELRSPRLTVRVFDYARMPVRVLRYAGLQAAKVLRKAGIEPEWLACSPPSQACDAPMAGRDLVIRIVNRDPSGAGRAFARAIQPGDSPGVYATVYYGRVADAASRAGVSASLWLALAMDHEVAHLLGLADGQAGVMRAVFGRRDMDRASCGLLRFAPGEEEQLRAGMATRLAAEPIEAELASAAGTP